MFSHLFWHQEFAIWAQWLWPVLLNHLWQATLFTLAALALAQALPRYAARWRQPVWLLAFAKFLMPAALLLALFDAAGAGRTQPPVTQPRLEPTRIAARTEILYQLAQPVPVKAQTRSISIAPATPHNELACLLTLVWLNGAALLLLRWGWRYRRFAQSLCITQGVEPALEREAFERVYAQMQLNSQVALVVTSNVSAAGAFGIRRPFVVLPAGLAEKLCEAELEAVLAHELTHVQRRDNLWSAAQMLTCCLFWFHPLVWLLDRKLRDEREWLCDEAVVGNGHPPQLYAASLWKAAQFGLGWPTTELLAGSAQAHGADLKRRIEMLLRNDALQRLPLQQRAVVALSITLLLALTIIFAPFARPGAHAQSDQSPTSVRLLPGVFRNENNNTRISEQLNQTPEIPLHVKNRTEAPLLIQGAKIQAVQYSLEYKPNVVTTNCAWRLQITLTNQSGRRVKGFAYEWARAPGTRGGLLEYPYVSLEAGASFEPLATWTFGKTGTSYGSCKQVEGDLTQIELSVAGVQFENEPHWGSFQSYATGMPIHHTMEIYASGHPPTISAEARQIVRASEAGQFSNDDDTVYDLKSVDTPPVITFCERPVYPDTVRDQRIGGLVILSAVLHVDGSVSGLRVERGLSGGLTEYAIESARKLRFQPATKNGQPVNVRMPLEYRFGG